MINSFTDLLAQATAQSNAQRLLFLFAESQVTSTQSGNAEQQQGTLTPVMCVDKLPGELSSFQALVVEADTISKGWDMVFIAGLSGDGEVPPSTEDADPYLNQMTNNLTSGQDLSSYLVFDRAENLIVMETR